MVDEDGGVRCSVGGEDAPAFELFEFLGRKLAKIGIACDRVFACIEIKLLPVSPTAPPNKMALSLLMGVMVWPNLDFGLSPPKLLSFYI